MKKLILSATMLFAFAANAQDISDNALGLRLGSNDGFGAEVSYQRALGDSNRLELDLGWRSDNHVDAIKLTGLYQWVWNIDGGFNWYAGAGGGLGFWDREKYKWNNGEIEGDNGTFFFAAGDIGIEYNFDFPLQLSLDFRPELYFNDDWRDGNFGSDIGLGVRYRF